MTIECAAEPPSDHDWKFQVVPEPSVCDGASTPNEWPSHDVSVFGAVYVVPARTTFRPAGLVEKVRSTFLGRTFRVTVVLTPRESVAVS